MKPNIGDLVVTVNHDTGETSTERVRVVFESGSVQMEDGTSIATGSGYISDKMIHADGLDVPMKVLNIVGTVVTTFPLS